MKIKRRTLTAIKIWFVRISVLIVVVSIWYVYFLTSVFTITHYQVEGVSAPLRAEITGRLFSLGEVYSYKVIPRGKIVTYSSKAIRNMIQGVVPESSKITIRPTGFNSLQIEISVFTPSFRVSETQALTKDGFIFTTRENISSYPLLKIASSTTRLNKYNNLLVTELVLPHDETKNFLEDIVSISSKISSVIFPVSSVIVNEEGDVVCLHENQVSKVIFSKDSDTKKLWSTLLSAVDTDPLKTKLLNDKEKLEYLDVRFGNKVFYRFSDMAFQKGLVTGILEDHGTTTEAVQESVPGTR